MKKGKGKFWLLIIVAALLLIGSVVYLISAAATPDVESFPIVGWIGIAVAIVCVIIAFVQKSQNSEKNTHVVEGIFLSIGKYGDGWVGCYFEIDGKQTRVGITKDVYNPKLLMPGGKYRITRKNKNYEVISVERID